MSHRQGPKHQHLGGRVGPRIASLTSQAMSDHLRRTASMRAKIGTESALGVFKTMTREKWQHISPLWSLYLKSGQIPSELEKVLAFIAHGEGEASEILNMLGMGSAVGTGISSAIANYLAPVNQGLMAKDPNTLLSPEVAAQAQVRGVAPGWDFSYEHLGQALSRGRYDMLVELARQWPGIGEALELWRRGDIDQGTVERIMTRNGIHPSMIPELLHLKRVHLSPADAALANLRGIIDDATGEQIAALSGVDADDFHILVANTGEPPGLMQLLEAYRRGIINKARLDKGIRQSRVRTEWTDVVEALRFTPASPADALRGVVQNHISNDEGKRIAEEGGLRPADWDWLVATEGNPPGVQQMLELHNRGELSDSQLDQGIRESRLKNKYLGPVKKLAVKLPEGRQVVTMLTRGALTKPRAMEVLRDLGYQQDIATALLDSAVSGQVAREKLLAQGQVVELYHDHALTEDEALKHLEALGYHTSNAKLILHLTDLKRARAQQEAALSPIRSMFVGRHIDKPTASMEIDKLGVPASQRDHLLELWEIERYAHRKSLTEAQIVKANEKELFTDEVALRRLEGLGYTNEDARVLLDLEKGRATLV